MRKTVTAALALALVMAAEPAGATILTFEALNVNDGDPVPAAYGDNVNPLCDDDECCDTIGCYAPGNGFTPNVTVEYRTIHPSSGTRIYEKVKYWEDDYGDLEDVAIAAENNMLTEISLVPEPGFRVVLNKFDLAGWRKNDVEGQLVRIVDADRRVLIDFSPVHVEGGSTVNPDDSNDGYNWWDLLRWYGTHTTIAPPMPIVSSTTIRIQFGTSWRVGIDNIDFDQQISPATPEDECNGVVDLACQASLNQSASDLLACEANIISYREEVVLLEEEIAQLEADTDGDGVRDLDDTCPDTVAGYDVDRSGCARDQFCALINASVKTGRKLCPRLDWKNDEPFMRTRDRDCTIDKGSRGTADDRCVPA